MTLLRWGICSAGRICDDFVNAMSTLPAGTHKVQAVAARDLESAKEFARKHGIPTVYSDYTSLFADKDVDIIYVGTINSGHESAVLSALDAGKHVLCEKPMAVNAQEATRMIRKAQEKQLFLMEAYWTRFFPAVTKLGELLSAGEIGDARIFNANFGFILTGNVLKREYAGGATMGLGCYLPMLANFIFASNTGHLERPQKVVASGTLNENGVDKTVSVTLHYSNGRIANFLYTVEVETVNDAFVAGTKGTIRIPDNFWTATGFVAPSGTHEFALPESDRVFNFPRSVGLSYEAEHVRQCILQGKQESPIMPLEESLILAEVTDEIRRQLGVRFPQDEK